MGARTFLIDSGGIEYAGGKAVKARLLLDAHFPCVLREAGWGWGARGARWHHFIYLVGVYAFSFFLNNIWKLRFYINFNIIDFPKLYTTTALRFCRNIYTMLYVKLALFLYIDVSITYAHYFYIHIGYIFYGLYNIIFLFIFNLEPKIIYFDIVHFL